MFDDYIFFLTAIFSLFSIVLGIVAMRKRRVGFRFRKNAAERYLTGVWAILFGIAALVGGLIAFVPMLLTLVQAFQNRGDLIFTTMIGLALFVLGMGISFALQFVFSAGRQESG